VLAQAVDLRPSSIHTAPVRVVTLELAAELLHEVAVRGDPELMSPRRMFHSWGNSSSELRQNLPNQTTGHRS
jgi:hypothetical protein